MQEIAARYGVLKKDAGVALRGLYIINPEGVLEHITINNFPVGRNVDEALRTLQVRCQPACLTRRARPRTALWKRWGQAGTRAGVAPLAWSAVATDTDTATSWLTDPERQDQASAMSSVELYAPSPHGQSDSGCAHCFNPTP